ncbi:MAG TPA: HIT family protein [Verrucomicrobiae bacterium]|nr:HIT family protein [Verrucomicrobiae bacterium]
MQESIFTKIIKGEIPVHKLYEDDHTLVFLDNNPVRLGHTLVISKKQIDQYIDLPDEDYLALWKTVKKVAAKLRATMDKERVGIMVKGIDVPHTHVHLIPFDAGESFDKDEHSPQLTTEQYQQLAEKLRLS